MANKATHFLNIYTGPNQFTGFPLAQADKNLITRLHVNTCERVEFFKEKEKKRIDRMLYAGIVKEYIAANTLRPMYQLTLFGESVYAYMNTHSNKVGIIELNKQLKNM